MAEDGDLARAAAGGDRGAFTALMAQHQAMIHRLVSRYVGADDAADLTQETFVAAWRHRTKFDPRQRFDIWLRTIAINKCRDHARRAAVRRLLNAPADDSANMRADEQAPSPEQTASDRQQLNRLQNAIKALPANLRDALILTALDGLSHTEAGAVLGISAKSVETRVYRARQRLAQQLNISDK